MWCGGHGVQVVSLCSLGCRQLGRAALQLESERWFVRATALEGALDVSRRARRSDISRGAGSEGSTTSRVVYLVSCG
jgi:hypothetical protein